MTPEKRRFSGLRYVVGARYSHLKQSLVTDLNGFPFCTGFEQFLQILIFLPPSDVVCVSSKEGRTSGTAKEARDRNALGASSEVGAVTVRFGRESRAFGIGGDRLRIFFNFNTIFGFGKSCESSGGVGSCVRVLEGVRPILFSRLLAKRLDRRGAGGSGSSS